MHIVIVGGGAAGFFAAIRAAELLPGASVQILERGNAVLSKVRVSGGGRCNLTHACFSARDLVKNYPRGERELLGPFHQFSCSDTVEWFEARGVPTKIESDGRIFPVSNKSLSIIDCLMDAARNAGVKIHLQHRISDILPPEHPGHPWKITVNDGVWSTDRLLIATGSSPAVWEILGKLGIAIIPPVPSLFTFNIQDERIQELPGLSAPAAEVHVEGSKLKSIGPLLITHWGMSGPAILKLSAWGARELCRYGYDFNLRVNWTGIPLQGLLQQLEAQKNTSPRQQVCGQPMFQLPTRLWRNLVLACRIPESRRWAEIGKKEMQQLVETLGNCRFKVQGKSTFKEEFVTAGGVDLKEINFKTFESKRLPGLFFAGEVLDIDAITGGFNFQAAWTGGWIAGGAMVMP